MNIEEILSRFEQVRRSGRSWIARCPAHDDKVPSLSIREKKGKILLECFAGCTLDEICVAAGINKAERLDKIPNGPASPVIQRSDGHPCGLC